MSLLASSLMGSNGRPHTWIQNGYFENVTDLTNIPFSHLHKAKRWLSKHQGPLFQTHSNWLSIENLNYKSPLPTSVIFISSPRFHIFHNKFFAAHKFICFNVRCHPIRLRENSSKILSVLTNRIDIASSSSVVSLMFCIHSSTSNSMVTTSICLLTV